MSYNGKTDWKLNDTVYPEDMNRIEGQIGKNTSEIEGVSGKIGNSSDNEEQLTLFGKLAAILTKVLGIDTKVGTSEDAKTKPTLFGKIAGIGDTLSENLTPVTEKITEVLNKVTGSDNKIGTEADADTQPTLFGRIAKVLKAVLGIDTKIGTSGDTAGSATLFGQVKDISEKMPTGIVKSIQRGYVKDRQTFPLTISISPVNPEKSIVILDGAILSGNAAHEGTPAALANFTSNSFTVIGNGATTTVVRYNVFSWQVIEFF